ncbi:hypothetical protein TNIN_11351 [Trichonephila inaurata madagascariensis]|uniref:Uncharacterized protein n=1 Tax=Trichonephila inaurata madagascariensis TaxID=2747483 RepID=A0A8X6XGH9_9ARAC|nr:hypothetical protein TNIN_11351 [Trichonephila inaurata madagascariensis]
MLTKSRILWHADRFIYTQTVSIRGHGTKIFLNDVNNPSQRMRLSIILLKQRPVTLDKEIQLMKPYNIIRIPLRYHCILKNDYPRIWTIPRLLYRLFGCCPVMAL